MWSSYAADAGDEPANCGAEDFAFSGPGKSAKKDVRSIRRRADFIRRRSAARDEHPVVDLLAVGDGSDVGFFDYLVAGVEDGVEREEGALGDVVIVELAAVFHASVLILEHQHTVGFRVI